MRAWVLAAPLGYIAVESGWIVRCVGRQPWALYGQLRTADAVSNIPASNVLTSLSFFAVVYSFLFVCALYFGSRIIRKGPNLNLPVPGLDNQPEIENQPAEHIADRRPVEAQQ
jgi:cytochrome d ubiquinol oxidase subunit I